MSTVHYAVDGHVATLTLDRPPFNAMNDAVVEDALTAVRRAAQDDAVRVVVLTGAGKRFSVGGDLNAHEDDHNSATPEAMLDHLTRHLPIASLLRDMPKVTIAAVNGAAAGAGMAWACATDVRIAAESAVFRVAFLAAGMTGDFGLSWTLPRIVGDARARDLYFRNPKIDAARALELGIVSEVLPDAGFAEAVAAIAAEIAAQAPLALAGAKANLAQAATATFDEALVGEAGRHIEAAVSDDATEAANAFLQKREPTFAGR